MGNFYGSVQIRTSERDRVKTVVGAVCAEKKIRCLLGPVIDGWVGVYPENDGQGDTIARLMEGHVLELLVHDDAVLAYRLWRDHVLVDSYWSSPGCLREENRADEESRRGDPEQFRPIIGERADQLSALLDRDVEYTFEGDRLKKFAKLLGISNALTAYDYLISDERHGIKGWRKFEQVPPAVKSGGQATKRKLAKSARTALQKAGFLTYVDERKEFFILGVGCATRDGFILGWSDHTHRTNQLSKLCGPWESPNAQTFEAPTYAESLMSNPLSDLFLLTTGQSALVVDGSSGTWIQSTEIAAPHPLRGAAFSRSANLVACAGGQQVEVSELSSGKRLCAFSRRNPSRMAIHPSGKWVAVSDDNLGIIYMDGEPRISTVLVGKNFPVTIDNIRGIEEPGCVGFSRDGRYIWCGTNTGLRVFEWEPLVNIPRKRVGWNLTIQIPLPSFWAKQVTAIVEEIDGSGIVFGTFRGKLLKLDLETGDYYKLADLPGGGEVKTLLFSGDGKALAVYSDYSTQKGPRSMPEHTRSWEIFDYHKLREARTLLGRMKKPPTATEDSPEDLSRWRRVSARGNR